VLNNETLYNQIYAVNLFYTVKERQMQLHNSLYKTMRNTTDTQTILE